MNIINVIVVEPEKPPYGAKIERGLKSLQEAVSGSIEVIYPFDDPVAIVCNEEGKLQGLPLNRGLTDKNGELYDVVAGTFLVCGMGDEDFTTLTPNLMEKYKEHFKCPEMFMRTPEGIKAIKIQPQSRKEHKKIEQER